ncbi:hypothetical protein TNCV_4084161 [Trichonephila clavipes]|nr:hypothetical protein TNCV_4084161 [Trichonephila clavipes]
MAPSILQNVPIPRRQICKRDEYVLLFERRSTFRLKKAGWSNYIIIRYFCRSAVTHSKVLINTRAEYQEKLHLSESDDTMCEQGDCSMLTDSCYFYTNGPTGNFYAMDSNNQQWTTQLKGAGVMKRLWADYL